MRVYAGPSDDRDPNPWQMLDRSARSCPPFSMAANAAAFLRGLLNCFAPWKRIVPECFNGTIHDQSLYLSPYLPPSLTLSLSLYLSLSLFLFPVSRTQKPAAKKAENSSESGVWS